MNMTLLYSISLVFSIVNIFTSVANGYGLFTTGGWVCAGIWLLVLLGKEVEKNLEKDIFKK